jgi:hypothetical protein
MKRGCGDPGLFLSDYFDRYNKRYCRRVERKELNGVVGKETTVRSGELCMERREEQGREVLEEEDWDDPLPDDWEINPEEDEGDLDACDVEAHSRQEYEMWEMEQIREYEEWELARSALEMEKRYKKMIQKKVIIKNVKRPKEETGREKWLRWQDERETKEIKKVVRMAKKMKREGKIKAIDSYFSN